jgi:lipopolysaccharide biosynthesis protein
MKKILVFAHYHQLGIVRGDTYDALNEFKKYFAEIIFVSTNLRDDHHKKLSRLCKVFVRENIGFDILSYKYGIEYCMQKAEDFELHLLNSSNIIADAQKLISNFYKKINFEQADIFGITQSHEQRVHIQSYAMSFSGKTVNSDIFKNWWTAVAASNDKKEIIKKYEVGMSSYFIENGLSLKSIFYSPPFKVRGILNPSHAFAQEIYQYFSLIKLEIIKSNPASVDVTYVIREMLRNQRFIKYIQDAMSN